MPHEYSSDTREQISSTATIVTVPELKSHTPTKSENTNTSVETETYTPSKSVTNDDTKEQKEASASNFLSTLTKSPKKNPQRTALVANRFNSFKNMAGSMAAKASDQNANANRFAGFKNMAGNMAAKGAERVAKVKDQMQKEGEGQNANRFAGFKSIAGSMAAKGSDQNTNTNRFANFKTMAGSMAAKGAEKVAAVKTQIQKEEDGQNINVKRFANFKSMAGNIAAKGAKSVSSDQVKQKLAAVQVPQRLTNAAKLLGKGNIPEDSKPASTDVPLLSAADTDTSDSSPQSSSETKASSNTPPKSASPTTTGITANATPPTTATNPPSVSKEATVDVITNLRDLTSENEKSSLQEQKSSVSETVEASVDLEKSADGQQTQAKSPEKNSPSSQVPNVQTSPQANNVTDEDANMNDFDASNSATKSSSAEAASMVQQSSEDETDKPDIAESPEKATPVSTINTDKGSKSDLLPVSTTIVNDASEAIDNSTTPSTKEESLESEAEKSTETVSKKKMEAAPVNPDNNGEAPVSLKPTSLGIKPKSSLSESSGLTPSVETKSAIDINPAAISTKLQSPSKPESTKDTSDQIEALQKELHAAHTLIMQLQHHENIKEESPGDAVMVELQANLQNEMTRRAEAEEKCRQAVKKSKSIGEEHKSFKAQSESKIKKLNSDVKNLEQEQEINEKQLQILRKKVAESERLVKTTKAKAKEIEEDYKTFKTKSKGNIETLTTNLEKINKEKQAMEKELKEIREERDEQHRKETSLTTRLNSFTKTEGSKKNAIECYKNQVEQLEIGIKESEAQVESLTAQCDQLKVGVGEWKDYAENRSKQLETMLSDEKKLNDERKRKMKEFVEAACEEVRSTKADYVSLQTELDQTSHSLTELNQRHKQLHAQWIQSQTRNRELQRDAMKMKKDSEKKFKVSGSLEARLSRSAQLSEDHKNKRLQARNELMSVLGQLEAEKAVNNRLQDSIRLSFTPKALSQQQTIQEALDDFEGALNKLATRIGRPLPPTFSSDPNGFNQDIASGSIELNAANSGDPVNERSNQQMTLSEINTNKAVQKLENETQRVSEKLTKFIANVERMHDLLDGGGAKNCVDVLSQILLKSGNARAIAADPAQRRSSGQRYGKISPNLT